MNTLLKSGAPVSPAIDRLAAVQRLLAACRPPAVFGRVGAIVVNSVELMIRRWSTAHVSEKADVVVPVRVDCDAPAAITLPILVLGIATAVAHVGPDFPFGSVSSPIAVSRIFAADGCVFGAAAGSHISGLQVRGRNDMVGAAVTTAKPVRVAGLCVSQRDDSEEAETLVCKVAYHPYQYAMREG